MLENLIKSQGPMLIRQALIILFTYLAANGAISEEQNTYLSGQLDMIVGLIGNIATIAWALWKRPSAKALEVAKEADKMPKKANIEIIAKEPDPDFEDAIGEFAGEALGKVLKKVVIRAK